MFDGQAFAKKPPQPLRKKAADPFAPAASSTSDQKAKILADAEAQRKARAVITLKGKLATLIQAKYRRHRVLTSVLQSIRSELQSPDTVPHRWLLLSSFAFNRGPSASPPYPSRIVLSLASPLPSPLPSHTLLSLLRQLLLPSATSLGIPLPSRSSLSAFETVAKGCFAELRNSAFTRTPASLSLTPAHARSLVAKHVPAALLSILRAPLAPAQEAAVAAATSTLLSVCIDAESICAPITASSSSSSEGLAATNPSPSPRSLPYLLLSLLSAPDLSSRPSVVACLGALLPSPTKSTTPTLSDLFASLPLPLPPLPQSSDDQLALLHNVIASCTPAPTTPRWSAVAACLANQIANKGFPLLGALAAAKADGSDIGNLLSKNPLSLALELDPLLAHHSADSDDEEHHHHRHPPPSSSAAAAASSSSNQAPTPVTTNDFSTSKTVDSITSHALAASRSRLLTSFLTSSPPARSHKSARSGDHPSPPLPPSAPDVERKRVLEALAGGLASTKFAHFIARELLQQINSPASTSSSPHLLSSSSQQSQAPPLPAASRAAFFQYGVGIVASTSDSSDSAPNGSSMPANPVLSLVELLATTLHMRSGLHRPNPTQCKLLNALAFDAGVCKGLFNAWLTLKNEALLLPGPRASSSLPVFVSPAYDGLLVFCDVLSQMLVARSDKDVNDLAFLRSVVLELRPVLQLLYWTTPVRITELQGLLSKATSGVSDLRTTFKDLRHARLLTSGTKLWNLLYDRWARVTFCEEVCWHFDIPMPGVTDRGVTVDLGGAVRPFNDDDMDDDDDDGGGGLRRRNDAMPRSASAVTAMDEGVQQEGEDDALVGVFKDAKMARVLNALPMTIKFENRVAIFHSLLAADKRKTQDEMLAMRMFAGGRDPGIRIEVRRPHIYQDSMEELNSLGSRLRSRVQVELVNEYGAKEAGIDGGGLFKEFMDDLIRASFSPENQSLFEVTDEQLLKVNPAAVSRDKISHFEFLGRILGKAVYESILVEPQFSVPFLNKVLGRHNTLDDLKGCDYDLWKNLMALREMGDEVNSLGLSFEVMSSVSSSGEWLGEAKRSVELCYNGSATPVTSANCIQYIHLLANFRLNVETATATKAFLRGFRDIIPAAWVRMFSALELQKLVGGDTSNQGIDIEDLKSVVVYAGGYHPSQPYIMAFWEVVSEFTPEQQRALLKFCTSCSRQPLLGFKALTPVPAIQRVQDDERLPTSATCMNLLKLPQYPTKELLKQKLLYAILSGAGFELS